MDKETKEKLNILICEYAIINENYGQKKVACAIDELLFNLGYISDNPYEDKVSLTEKLTNSQIEKDAIRKTLLKKKEEIESFIEAL